MGSGKRLADSVADSATKKKVVKLDSSETGRAKKKKQKKQHKKQAERLKSPESSTAASSSEAGAPQRKTSSDRRKRHHRQQAESKIKSASKPAHRKKSKVKKRNESHLSDDESAHSESPIAKQKSKKPKTESKAEKKRSKKKKKEKATVAKKAKASKSLKKPANDSSSSSSSSSSKSSESSALSSPTSAGMAGAPCPYEHSDAEADAAEPGPDCPPLRPIVDYLDDRVEMLHQMFSAVRGRQLRALVPEEFRRLTLTQLRDRCLPLLQGMSAKRIRRILAGDDAAAISSSDTDESAGEEQKGEEKVDISADAELDVEADANKKDSSSVPVIVSSHLSTPVAAADSTTPEDPVETLPAAPTALADEPEDSAGEAEAAIAEVESEADASVASVDSNAAVEAEAASECEDAKASSVPEESEALSGEKADQFMLSPAEVEADSVILNEVVDLSDVEEEPAPPPAKPQPSLGGMTRRQLEIMELEMRARAIKAMISAQEKTGSAQSTI